MIDQCVRNWRHPIPALNLLATTSYYYRRALVSVR